MEQTFNQMLPELVEAITSKYKESDLLLGKTEKQHLKLNLDSGEHKIPVMFWGAADKINSEFNVGDNINLVYNVERNVFNGMETLQLVALDIQK